MAEQKRLRVGRFNYVLDEYELDDIAVVTGQIQQAMADGGVVSVNVLDEHGRRLTLYLNGSLLDVVAVDLGLGPRPGEIS